MDYGRERFFHKHTAKGGLIPRSEIVVIKEYYCCETHTSWIVLTVSKRDMGHRHLDNRGYTLLNLSSLNSFQSSLYTALELSHVSVLKKLISLLDQIVCNYECTIKNDFQRVRFPNVYFYLVCIVRERPSGQ